MERQDALGKSNTEIMRKAKQYERYRNAQICTDIYAGTDRLTHQHRHTHVDLSTNGHTNTSVQVTRHSHRHWAAESKKYCHKHSTKLRRYKQMFAYVT